VSGCLGQTRTIARRKLLRKRGRACKLWKLLLQSGHENWCSGCHNISQEISPGNDEFCNWDFDFPCLLWWCDLLATLVLNSSCCVLSGVCVCFDGIHNMLRNNIYLDSGPVEIWYFFFVVLVTRSKTLMGHVRWIKSWDRACFVEPCDFGAVWLHVNLPQNAIYIYIYIYIAFCGKLLVTFV
jgi:hypothetical protein